MLSDLPGRQGFSSLLAFLLIGFTAVIAQVVLMRELIVVFHGNELSLGLVLAGWLFWTALGSAAAGRLASSRPHVRMAVLQVLISLAFPLGILAARFSRNFMGSLPGEILGPGAMLVISLSVLCFFCILSGALFAAGSRLYASQAAGTDATASSSIYLLEAIGSGAGGLVASLVLIRHWSPFEIAALLAALNLMSAVFLAFKSAAVRGAGSLAALSAIAILTFGSGRLESWSLRHLWRGFDLLESRNSNYGNLAVVAAAGNRSLFENGLVMATAPDPAAAEEAVHYALLEHPRPSSLLLIGGGENGSIAQALRHDGISRIDYVELDSSIPDLARRFFAEGWRPAEDDPRVKLHYIDGRLFVKRATGLYDVIIVNLPAPQTAQLNRFYTVEFFREAAQRLNPGGIVSFQLAGSENYISPELAVLLRCIHKSLREVFPDVVVLPGDPIHFFASPQRGSLTADPIVLVARLRARGLGTVYVREYYLPFRMTPDRTQDLESALRPESEARVNRDFEPIAYYFELAYWSARFAPNQRRWFLSLSRVPFGAVAAVLVVGMMALAGLPGLFRSGERRRRARTGLCVAVMGFTLIALEMLLLLGFQSLYGYVYQGLSLLIAAFMVGIACGSWLALRRGAGKETLLGWTGKMRGLASIQAAAGVFPVLMTGSFYLLAGLRNDAGIALASQVVFPLFALACGCLGGYQFPRAGAVYYSSMRPGEENIGALYALDLAGSCLGAVLLSLYLVPVFGFLKSALLLGLVNLVPALFAWRTSSETQSA